MVFRRSNNALSVSPRFYRVDFLVFTEGRESSYSSEEIETVQRQTQTNDTKFWSSIFQHHNFPKKYHMRSLGSKHELEELAYIAIEGGIKHVCIALDADMDFLYDRQIKSPYVIYTYGYSWENEVYSKDQVLNYVNNSALTNQTSKTVTEEINLMFRKFTQALGSIMSTEFRFRVLGVSFAKQLLNDRFFITGRKGVEIDEQEVRRFVRETIDSYSLSKNNSLPIPTDATLVRYAYGKLVEHFAYLVVRYIRLSYSDTKSPLPKVRFREKLVNQFIDSRITKYSDFYRVYLELLLEALESDMYIG